MQPLIKLRLLASQLQTYERQQLLQKIGFDTIMSLIFKEFLLTYNKTQQHHNELSNLTNIISEIINSRQEDKSNSSHLTNTITLQIDELPFELIGECASYLDVNNYMNFSLCNRNIYCATNSPMKLEELDISKYYNYNMINLKRFSMVKGLCIRPRILNALKIQNAQFPYLHKLYLVNDDEDIDGDENDINKFIINSKAINFDQITHLSLLEFGTYDNYEFDSFCNLLLQFTNITHLELDNIHLTEFEANDKIVAITPKLQALDCINLRGNNSVNLLRNTLLKMHCKQILHLCVDFLFDIGVYSFPKLNLLWVFDGNDNVSKVLSSSLDIKTIELGYNSCNKSETIQNSLIKSFTNTQNISVLRFCCLNKMEMEYITSTVEKMLSNSKEKFRNTLKIRILLNTEENISMLEIELYITRIINALDLTHIQNKMLIFHIPKKIDTDNYRYKIIERFKLTHLAVTHNRICDNDRYSIIISNKNCKINGYHSRRTTKLKYVTFHNDNNII